ncbi:2790_t:CDS:2 [Ambispora leptoticha]|uniref:2790_t:CDS:1 n=1 Tax=Ambispora leptoticha TaxID=144679 RepID=A0A9N9CBN6_9GLOM|nr:2790_t:CDS:2 [Ambispora leptoticha]
MEDGVEVPKYEILIPLDNPELEKEEKIDVNIRINNRQFEKGYCYEISFTDSKDLLKKPKGGQVRNEDKRKRIFHPNSSITIKDNSYEKILEQLKNEKLAGISDKNSTKYKEGREFIEELEAEKIAKLEVIVGRTPQQEQDLKDKKQELADLEKEKQEQSPNQKS